MFRILVSIVLIASGGGGALASFDDGRLWFEGLTESQRAATQTDLILLGHYDFLVDGQFGRGTFEAIEAFQRSQGTTATGILSASELSALAALAAEVDTRLGLELVRDQAANVAMMVPTALLSERTPTDAGTTYASTDGEFSLETMQINLAGMSFSALFDELSGPDLARVVTYSNFGDERFVVSGTVGAYSYYTYFVAVGDMAVGYSLAWGAGYAKEGAIAAVYLASNFSPLGLLPPDEETRKASSPAPGGDFGAFRLPADQPQLIVLNGDITSTTWGEFDRALAARPEARIVVLNSPGGMVDSALIMAREIRKLGLRTYVPRDMGCYSACAYMFFAGEERHAAGELGVHQISSDVADLVLAQTTLGDVLDALEEFGVEQPVVSHMLRTPPGDMYVFSIDEIADFGINRGEPIELAVAVDAPTLDPGLSNAPGDAAFVQLSSLTDYGAAARSLKYLAERWAGLFGDMRPEVETTEVSSGAVYRIRLPVPSIERANTICAAIKSEGGGCYVTRAGT